MSGGAAEGASDPLHLLLARKLGGYDEVSDIEIDILKDCVKGPRSFSAGQDLVQIDQRPS